LRTIAAEQISIANESFTSQTGLIPALISEQNNNIIVTTYVAMCQRTLGFIDVFLRNAPEARQKWVERIDEF